MGNRSDRIVSPSDRTLRSTVGWLDNEIRSLLVSSIECLSRHCTDLLHRLPIGRPKDEATGMSIVLIKFLVSNLIFFGYTCQLCLTTVCTPSIYFDWFLLVSDCRYTYSNLL